MAQVTGSSQTTTDANGQQHESVTLTATDKKKDDKVVQTKDTKKELRKEKKLVPVEGADAKLPDKQLYDKAVDATKRGHFDVARLDLQTLLNTYPDSQFQMRAKLAIADSWYKEGGTAALTQAESEYKDFITFFPNAPEAAEAQMRVGDIYFRQMDKPDRDYAKATHAEEEYRLMLQQFPESTLVPQAKQRLREVQEVMATREADIAAYYSTHNNWPATIARYQTVVDTYPQFSHMDDVLVGLGDAYEAEARYVRTLRLPEAGKARLEHVYDDQAAAAYTKVILEHSAAPHVEDARDRLEAMNLPIPTPTPEQMAASLALENSRRQYRLQDRVGLMFMHKADVVLAARDGDPSLTDASPTLAPHITTKIIADFKDAMNPNAGKPAPSAPTPAPEADPNATAPTSAEAAPAAAPAATPLQFQ
jgi:outer membrane protein assembly factor BamD